MTVYRITRAILGGLLFMSIACGAPAHAEGLYIQGEIGRNIVDENIDISGTGISLDKTLSAARVAVGYQFNDFIAVEGAYVDLGDAGVAIPGGRFNLSADGKEVAVIASIPLGERLSVGVTGGVLWYDALARAAGVRAQDSDNDGFFGATATFEINERVGIVARVVRYGLDDLDTLYGAIGVQFRF